MLSINSKVFLAPTAHISHTPSQANTEHSLATFIFCFHIKSKAHSRSGGVFGKTLFLHLKRLAGKASSSSLKGARRDENRRPIDVEIVGKCALNFSTLNSFRIMQTYRHFINANYLLFLAFGFLITTYPV